MIQELSKHFMWAEASITSYREFDNEIPESLYENVKLCAFHMDKIRDFLGFPIYVNSWYRSKSLNAFIKGSETSEHCLGTAVDWICPKFGKPLEVVRALVDTGHSIVWNQLILEHTWVHSSFPIPPAIPKMEVLTWLGGKKYAIGITDKFGRTIA